MKFVPYLFSVVGLLVFSSEVEAAPEPAIPLWSGKVPGETGGGDAEKTVRGKDGVDRASHVTVPTMTVYPAPAANRNGAAVLVLPGGGYNILSMNSEGSGVCKWLNEIGVTAVLLKYRVPRRAGLAKHHAPLQDAQRALGIMRMRAEEWHIDPKRIGVLGFSAGGHLAAMALGNPKRSYPTDVKIDAVSCRPDFGVLIYPAYLLDDKDPNRLSPELNFTPKSQPVFMAVASNDKWASSSARLYLELQKMGVPVEMHAYARGGHGFGVMREKQRPIGKWTARCGEWMKDGGLLESTK